MANGSFISSIIAMGLLAGLPGCKGPSAPAVQARPSLLLLTLDTTRADRIGAYGYAGAHTPNLDALAGQGALFRKAFSAVPLTTPSHATMLTGLYPTRHGIHSNGDAVLPDEVVTLAERLRSQGYHTAASVASYTTTRIWRLDQGFEVYFDEVRSTRRQRANQWGRERPATEVVDDAVRWLEGRPDDGQPFFIWCHLFDPHDPYEPPEEWAERLPNRPYDGEIAYMDDQIGRLLPQVEQAAGPGGLVIIAVGDHGEGLGEHGEMTHGMFLYDPTVHVPLIVRPAHPLPSPLDIRNTVASGVDVTPTALGLLGLEVPKDLDGTDLSPATHGEMKRKPAYMEAYTSFQRLGYRAEVGMVDQDYKLLGGTPPRLFDRTRDPGELDSLADRHPDRVAEWMREMKVIHDRAVESSQIAMAPEVIQQLAALGYLGTEKSLEGALEAPIDAKDRLDTILSIERARLLARDPSTLQAALGAYTALLAREPQLGEARVGLFRVYMDLGRMKEAEKIMKDAIQRDPSSTVLRVNLGQALMQMGRFAEARAEYEAVLVQVPGDGAAQTGVLQSFVAEESLVEAAELGMTWLQASPEDHSLQAILGMILVELDRTAEGYRLVEKSLADQVPRPRVCQVLALQAIEQGRDADAVALLLQELADFPDNHRARLSLAGLHNKAANWSEAASEYEYLTENGYEPIDSRRGQAQAIFNMRDYELASQILAPALKAAPEDPDVLLLQANILAKLGRMDEGEKLMRLASELNRLRLLDQQAP